MEMTKKKKKDYEAKFLISEIRLSEKKKTPALKMQRSGMSQFPARRRLGPSLSLTPWGKPFRVSAFSCDPLNKS